MSVEKIHILEEFQKSDEEGKASPILKRISGYVCAMVTALMLGSSAPFAQALEESIPGFELNTWRFLAQFIISLPIVFCAGLKVSVNKSDVVYLCVVCVGNVVFNYAFYAAPDYIPVATAGCMSAAWYVVLTLVITAALTRHCRLDSTVVTIVCVTGVVLATQPHFLFPSAETEKSTISIYCRKEISFTVNEMNSTNDFTPTPNPAVSSGSNNGSGRNVHNKNSNELLGYFYVTLAMSVYTSVNYVINIKLSHVNPFVVSVYVGLSGTVMSAIIMTIVETPTFPSQLPCLGFFLGHGVTASLASVLGIVAMVYISPQWASLLQTLRIPFLFCAQYTFLRHIDPGHRNAAEVVGVLLVFAANVFASISDLIKTKIQEQSKKATGSDATVQAE